jgi:hypothetical protein
LVFAQGEAPAPVAAQEPVVVKNPSSVRPRAFRRGRETVGANEAQLQTFATQIAELCLSRAADNLCERPGAAFRVRP